MANEKRPIDANAFAMHLADVQLANRGWKDDLCELLDDVLEALDEHPTLEAVEVVHGQWVTEWDRNHLFKKCYCSACGRGANKDTHDKFILSGFCPNCGAKMDGDENGRI